MDCRKLRRLTVWNSESWSASPRGIEIKVTLERKLKQLHAPEKWSEYHRYLKMRLEDRKSASVLKPAV